MTDLIFTLPYPLILPNRRGIAASRGAAAAEIKKERTRMAWEIAALISGMRPAAPLKFVQIHVFRRSLGEPDTDNLFASCKPLLDVLQPSTERRKYGLGVIENDDRRRCLLRAIDLKVKHRPDQCTRVVIREVDSREIAAARRAELEAALEAVA